MAERIQIGVNSGLMGGEVVEIESKITLQNCATELPCTLLSRSGHCSTILEGINTQGKPLHCGRYLNKPRPIPEES